MRSKRWDFSVARANIRNAVGGGRVSKVIIHEPNAALAVNNDLPVKRLPPRKKLRIRFTQAAFSVFGDAEDCSKEVYGTERQFVGKQLKKERKRDG